MKEKYSNERKKYKMLLVVSIIFGILLLGFGTYFYWFTGDSKTDEPLSDEKITSGVEYDNWVSYLLNQSTTRTSSMELSCESNDELKLETEWNSKDITDDEVKTILNRIMNSKIKKVYEPDLGVPICGKSLTIYYIKNGLEYYFSLEDNRIRGPEDNELIFLLDKDKEEEEKLGTCTSSEDCMFAYYFDTSW